MINHLPQEILSFICFLTYPTQLEYESYLYVCKWWRYALTNWAFLKKMIYDGDIRSLVLLGAAEKSLNTLIFRSIRNENFIFVTYNLRTIYANNCCELSQELYNRILKNSPRLEKIEWNNKKYFFLNKI